MKGKAVHNRRPEQEKMVGIVLVSHSAKLAEGARELGLMMAENVPIAAAGGLPDGTFGTDYERIKNAIDEVISEDGVLVLMDMGSAVMTTEMVLEEYMDRRVFMVNCPFAEGTVVAAVDSASGMGIEEIKEALSHVAATPKFMEESRT